jgi:cephalosporin-C deacetylase-like acetyl esterase
VVLLVRLPLAAQGAAVTVSVDREKPLYAVGEKAVFTIVLTGAGEQGAHVKYTLLEGGQVPIEQKECDLSSQSPRLTITHEWKKPSFVLLNVQTTGTTNDGKTLRVGAGCEPEKLPAPLPKPADFDAFWNARKAIIDALPANPILVPVPAFTDDAIETYAVTLDNINGSKVRGFFSKPKRAGKYPALLFVNAAGIYPVRPGGVARYARRGVIALDINPHDIENDQPQAYYDNLGQTTLKDWQHQGRQSRETSYFLRMFLSCYRAAEYLTRRAEWDGKHFVVTGSSMGGGQSFVTAYLSPKVTAFAANVAALCDHAGREAGRAPGWPRWVTYTDGRPDPAELEASRYFDAVNFARTIRAKALVSAGFIVNFARTIRAKALVSAGFIDTTCAPSSVYTAFNQLPGSKEMLPMPRAGHEVPPEWSQAQAAFLERELGLGRKP